ncbi:MAG: plastocyanin/azurin family copper-binding protein [Chitinophagaceae bacterium]|nr:plastocyanin/azurin family copper-binding protein [Chitinophagaceae bacterium]
MQKIVLLIGWLLGSSIVHAQNKTAAVQTEEDYYPIKTLSIPDDIKLEVGGIAVLPDGRLAVSTRRGEIWMIENAYSADGSQPHYKKFASGLHEVLGLAYKDGSFYCTQRSELTKITDDDHDGRADRFEPVYQFELSGNYHEYAYGPVFDKDGNMLVTLNVAWIDYGESLTKWHGWLLKIFPDGKMEPIATGLRSPAGFNVNSANDIFFAENQGDWVGSGRVTHLEKGDFAGNAGGLNWTGEPGSPLKLTKNELKAVDNGQPMHEAAKKIPQLKLPAVWFPHTLMGISTADIIEDNTSGAFGPFTGQYFVADQGHSKIMRMSLEKVNGKYQGACYPFREGFASGLLRLRWGIDGSMFGGMTSRGWASTGKEMYALQQLKWSGKTPFEIKEIKAMPDGFEIEFTQAADAKALQQAMNYELSSFTYKYHHFYGSPVINQSPRLLKGIIVSADGKKTRLVLDSLKEGYIHEVKLNNIVSAEGKTLLHNVGYYTLNAIPPGEKVKLTAQQTVKPHQHTMLAATKTTAAPKPSSAKRVTRMPADWKEPDQVLRIGTRPGLKFDKTLLQVKAGSKVKLVFNNNDDMMHNVVITSPGAADDVAALALNMGLKGQSLNYVPSTAKVLFYTALLQPNSSESIYFIAPDKPGDYIFVCTYPGHASVMRGVFKVAK